MQSRIDITHIKFASKEILAAQIHFSRLSLRSSSNHYCGKTTQRCEHGEYHHISCSMGSQQSKKPAFLDLKV
jgi:hypothetical protein